MRLFPTTFLLGLAGFDPTGAIIIISALAMGLSKKQIVKFALTTFVGTVIVGVLCSCFIGTSVNYLSNILNSIPDSIWLVLEIIVSIILLKWFIERVFFKNKTETKDEKKESFFIKYIKKGLFIVGLIFAITALTDPSFLALITLSGQSSNFIEVILANCVWISISQAPIFILTIAIIFNKHEKIIKYFKEKFSNNDKIEKLKRILSTILSVIILIAGLLTLAEVIYFLITKTWLF